MSIASVVLRGYGNDTVIGTIPLVVMRGFIGDGLTAVSRITDVPEGNRTSTLPAREVCTVASSDRTFTPADD